MAAAAITTAYPKPKPPNLEVTVMDDHNPQSRWLNNIIIRTDEDKSWFGPMFEAHYQPEQLVRFQKEGSPILSIGGPFLVTEHGDMEADPRLKLRGI